jgi:hypothetical protein
MNPRRARYLVPLVIVLLISAFQYQQRRWGTGWMPDPLREGLPTASNGTRDRGVTPSFRSGAPTWNSDRDIPWAIEAAALEAVDPWDEPHPPTIRRPHESRQLFRAGPQSRCP